jgi:hypothetical protein
MQQTILAIHAESDRLADRVKNSVHNIEVDDASYDILLTAALDIAELDHYMGSGYLDHVWFTNPVAG